MLRMFSNGIESYVVPDCAKCILSEKHPHEMDKCPMWKCEEKDQCDGDCEYYTEEWSKDGEQDG